MWQNCLKMGWQERFRRERERYDDGMRRLAPGQLLRLGNAAYGAGLCSLMLARDDPEVWFERAADRWRESWDRASPEAWGRPVGVVKAQLLAGRADAAEDCARWTIALGASDADSPVGRYAATLALLVLRRDPDAGALAKTLRGEDGFAEAAVDSLVALAERQAAEYEVAASALLDSFEARDSYLDDIPVADTVLVFQKLANARGIEPVLRNSALLPGSE